MGSFRRRTSRFIEVIKMKTILTPPSHLGTEFKGKIIEEFKTFQPVFIDNQKQTGRTIVPWVMCDKLNANEQAELHYTIRTEIRYIVYAIYNSKSEQQQMREEFKRNIKPRLDKKFGHATKFDTFGSYRVEGYGKKFNNNERVGLYLS